MNRPSHPPSLTRSLTLIVLLTSASMVAVTVFRHRRPGPADANGQPGPALPATGHDNSADPATSGSQRETRPRDESPEREAQRLAALDLAQRMSAKAGTLVHESMSDDGGEKFPGELLKELSHMNEEQFRIAALAAGKNAATGDAARTFLVTSMTNAWLHEHPDGGKKEARILLGVMEDLLPSFRPGFDSVPLGETFRHTATWDPEDTTAFLVKHWDRWTGSGGDSNMDQVRREVLEHIQDPQLRQQLEALPKAGND
jgi:hypothetical protein